MTKRRGRPPKVALEGGEVNANKNNEVVNSGAEDLTESVLVETIGDLDYGVDEEGNVLTVEAQTDIDNMNDLARRIWEGQGSLPIKVRVERIVMRLKAKGFTRINELVLPTNLDYKRYL